jgi:FkbM family methyltransferase
MKDQIAEGLVRIYGRATKGGILDRPRPRRAFEGVYLGYKRLIEAGPVDQLRELVTRGSTVIDVGANIGFFSLRFARWVGPSGRVIAIEPEVNNIVSLRRRIARAELSDVVTCIQAAAADTSGCLRLAVNPGHPGDHHLSNDGERVVAVTLDDVVAADPRPVTLVKIDVQGAESLVLDGARRLIRNHRPALFVEVHEQSLARLGSSGRELIESLLGLDYVAHRLKRNGISPRQDPDELIAKIASGYIDVLFLPRERESSTREGDVGEHSE